MKVVTGRLREPACWPGPYPKDDLQSPGELEVMINCQAIALNQERKPRTNKREPHVAPRHYRRNLANTNVHSRVCYPPSSDMRLQLSDDGVLCRSRAPHPVSVRRSHWRTLRLVWQPADYSPTARRRAALSFALSTLAADGPFLLGLSTGGGGSPLML